MLKGERRVVVTGLGIVSPLGVGARATWEGLKAGKNGVGPLTLLDHSKHDVHFGGEAPFKAEDYMDRKSARHMDRFAQMSVVASAEAVKDSGLDLQKEDTSLCGVALGTGIGGFSEIEHQYDRFRDKGAGRVSPFVIPAVMGNAGAAHVSINHGLRGPNFTVVTACASGSSSIGSAYRCIKWGEADIMVAGGAEAPITNLGLSGFANMGALSKRNDDPAHASRPFDRNRDGFVIAEGAGVVILEEYQHARKRGARIYCELLGFGETGDAHHITAPCPDGDGGVRAISMCLRDAQLNPEEVSYINAHGTSTPYNDKTETLAIKRVFGDYARRLPVSSTKSMTGHTLGAAGGIEFAVAALTIVDNVIHPTMNYETPDPDCDLDYVPNVAREKQVDVVVSISLGFGGHNAVLAVGRLR
jgi:3-oxoacyl-[acyl-carrier-protein] synthase II